MYPEKTTDKIMIPQWEYRKLRDIATRVDVLKAELEYQKKRHEDGGYNWGLTVDTSMVERILGPYQEKEYTEIETKDDLEDVLQYSD